MMTNLQAVTTNESKEIARPLKILVPLINEALDKAHEVGIEHRARAGLLLSEAKANFTKLSLWYHWASKTFKNRETGQPLSERTIRAYVHLGETTKEFVAARSPLPFRTRSEFEEPSRDSHHQPAWHSPIKERLNSVNVDHLGRELANKQKEHELEHDLGLKLIDIGYKALSTKLHPDKGGSAEAMARLNRVRDILKRSI